MSDGLDPPHGRGLRPKIRSRIRCITIPAHAFVQTFRNNHVVGINHSRILGVAGLASLDYCARERIRHHWLVVAHTATCHFY